MTTLLRRLVDVRADEVSRLVWSFVYFFFLLSSYFVMRPVREEMSVAGGLGKLPWLFTGTFAATLSVVPLWGALAARLPRRRLVPIAYRFFALVMVLLDVLLRFRSTTGVAGPLLYIWISVYNLFVVSVFWSLMTDLFSANQGRRLFGFIAAGGSAGAVTGPLLATALAPRLGPANLLLLSIVFLEIATQCVRRLVKGDCATSTGVAVPEVAREPAPGSREDGAAIGGGALAGIAQIVRSKYLLLLCAHVLLLTLTVTFLYFQQASVTAQAIADPGRRTAFFATIDLAVNVLSLLVQAVGTGRIIQRLGTGGSLAVLPLVTFAGFAGLAWSPSLTILVVAMTIRRAAGPAIERPAREVLFTVVSREEKYKAKNFIDTVVYRGGDAASGWLHAALTAGGLGIRAVALLSLPVSALWVGLTFFLGRRQESLARELHSSILPKEPCSQGAAS